MDITHTGACINECMKGRGKNGERRHQPEIAQLNPKVKPSNKSFLFLKILAKSDQNAIFCRSVSGLQLQPAGSGSIS